MLVPFNASMIWPISSLRSMGDCAERSPLASRWHASRTSCKERLIFWSMMKWADHQRARRPRAQGLASLQ
ncbi:MAG TPA: hypothetical protein PK670_16845, partial [Acidovorax defluvii]|nr:hypothetical protein [Acidovorax defluvii]